MVIRMDRDVELGCRCGRIHGWARGVSPKKVNRIICYCDDCQAFLHSLERADLLDGHGGTDVVQVAPKMVRFDRGTENISGLRLTTKGMYRWYASCCKTPLGNTLAPRIPFIGMPLEIFRGTPDAASREAAFGKPSGGIFGEFSVGGLPEGVKKAHLGHILRPMRLLIGWKLGGLAWPHPFFDQDTQAPCSPVRILSSAERDALRNRCGPRPIQ